MPSRSARFVFAVLALAAASAPAGSRPASFVPWKILKAGDPPTRAALSVYWIPASRDDFRRSELLRSDELSVYSSQCVAMQVVRPEDDGMLAKIGAEELPVVVMVDGEGRELGRILPERGTIRVEPVEDLVRRKVAERGAAAERMLDEARTKAEHGETEVAIDLYAKVWEQRCMCPRQGRDAYRALKKLRKE